MQKHWWIIASILTIGSLSLYSCEDDVIVEPSGEEEECTGSYCHLDTGRPGTLTLASTNTNPETF